MGVVSKLQNIREQRVSDSEAFIFILSLNKQVGVLLKYNTPVILDALYSICIFFEDAIERLYTLHW